MPSFRASNIIASRPASLTMPYASPIYPSSTMMSTGSKSVVQTKTPGARGGDPRDLFGAPFWIDDRTDRHHPGRQAECPDTNIEAGGRDFRTSDVNVVERSSHDGKLPNDFDHGLDIAKRSQGLCAELERGDQEGLAALRPQLVCLGFQIGLELFIEDIEDRHLGAHDSVEQEISLQHRSFHAVGQHQRHVEAEFARCGGDLATPIRLRISAGYDDVRATAEHLAKDEFELAGLVAAEGEPGQIIALDQHIDIAERLGESRTELERGRQMGQRDAGDLCQPIGERVDGEVMLRHQPNSPSGMPMLPVS